MVIIASMCVFDPMNMRLAMTAFVFVYAVAQARFSQMRAYLLSNRCTFDKSIFSWGGRAERKCTFGLGRHLVEAFYAPLCRTRYIFPIHLHQSHIVYSLHCSMCSVHPGHFPRTYAHVIIIMMAISYVRISSMWPTNIRRTGHDINMFV